MIITEMHFDSLPYYLKVFQCYNKETDTVHIEVVSRIHVNKLIKLPTEYSLGFVQKYPIGFRGEVIAQIVKQYNLKLSERKYE
jgi:hypothetical protein